MKFHDRSCRGTPCENLHGYKCADCGESFYGSIGTHWGTPTGVLTTPFYPACSLACYRSLFDKANLADPNGIYSDASDGETVDAKYGAFQETIDIPDNPMETPTLAPGFLLS